MTELAHVDSTEAQRLARLDMNFLAGLASPEDFTMPFPDFFVALFQLITEFKEPLERYALGFPRGFAKTSWIKVVLLWLVLFSSKRFLLIVGQTESHAANIIADVIDLLEHPNIVALFGSWKTEVLVDQGTFKVFRYRGRVVIIRGIGTGGSVRGINRNNARPDVILMDDIQKREDADNPELADALMRWMLGTLMKARSNSGCLFMYVGNMYPRNCILHKLKNNPEWTSVITGGILADGTSLWEELRPIKELMSEYRSDAAAGHPEIFLAEVLNVVQDDVASGINLHLLPHLPDYFNLAEADGSFILIDPSSAKKQADDCAISHFSVLDGIPVNDEIERGIFTPLQTIEKAIALGIRMNTRLICVEDVAYQSSLLFWFEHYCENNGIEGFIFLPVSPKNRNKNVRIKAGLINWLHGKMYVAPKIRSIIMAQLEEWNPLKSDNKDDIIDPLGYAEEVLREYGPHIVKQIFDNTPALPASHSSVGAF